MRFALAMTITNLRHHQAEAGNVIPSAQRVGDLSRKTSTGDIGSTQPDIDILSAARFSIVTRLRIMAISTAKYVNPTFESDGK